jgi:hypothetical protein
VPARRKPSLSSTVSDEARNLQLAEIARLSRMFQENRWRVMQAELVDSAL